MLGINAVNKTYYLQNLAAGALNRDNLNKSIVLKSEGLWKLKIFSTGSVFVETIILLK